MSKCEQFDVVIVGAGISGALIYAIAAQQVSNEVPSRSKNLQTLGDNHE